MEYKTENGKEYEISYSQRLQAEDCRLKRQIIVVGIGGLVLLLVIIVLFGMLLSGGTITKILHNVVC
jgi:hypothetical protein